MLIDKAREISLSIHGNQTDKLGVPYFAHVADVSKRVAHLGNDYAIVGLLHDAVEDAAPENQKALEEEIKKIFDDSIAYAIDCITKRKPPRYDYKEDYFEEYLPRLITSDIARSVKIADSSHNLSKAHLIEDEALQAKLRNKYIQVLDYLGVDGKSCEKPVVFQENQWIEMGSEV